MERDKERERKNERKGEDEVGSFGEGESTERKKF